MTKDFMAANSKQLAKKYPGKYVAIVNNKLAAVGNSNLDVFKNAKKSYPGKMVSIAYIPRKDELVTLL